jgi:hypothetical protein
VGTAIERATAWGSAGIDRAKLRPLVDFSLWDWLTRWRWRFVAFLVIATIVVIAALFIASLAAAGELRNFYEWLIENTTGEYWTDIMRRNPWAYGVPGAILFLIILLVLVPAPFWIPGALGTFVIFWLGFLGGHVFWGR